jgi:uncharacterized protein
MESKRLLIIFAKNPILGKVKTRLAKDIGVENALIIYQYLLRYTHDITYNLSCAKHLYYSDFIPELDDWTASDYQRKVQNGTDLGQRMMHAFQQGFEAGYKSILIIGSDNYDLTQSIIEQGFRELEQHDFVVGPANDGGYYLLGMKALDSSIFENKLWSTPSVLQDTLQSIQKLQSSVYLLPVLNDVDTVDDLDTLNALIENPMGIPNAN